MSLTSKYRVFIWDFDGTLFNTYPETVRGYLEILKEYGFEESFGQLESLARVSLIQLDDYLRERFGVGEDFFSRVVPHCEELSRAYSEPFPGAREFLSDVVAQGGQNQLYTHRDHVALELLERVGLLSLFSDAVTSEQGFAMKPAPDALRALLERNGTAPDEAIMIGDREIDVRAGANAGIDSCLIMPCDILAESCATYRAASFEELRILLETR